MKGARIRADGRRTHKQKPGPKPKSVDRFPDRNTLVLFHALTSFSKLRALFRDLVDAQGTGRNLARLAIAMVEGEAIEGRPGARVTTEKLDGAADAIVKQHRAIVRDGTRKEERAFLDMGARLLFDALRPNRAALPDHPIISTPAGIIGGRAWATKRAMKLVDTAAPAWVQAVQAGSAYLADSNTESRRIAERARTELTRDGFPISEILKRLNLT